jgi:hypothetical protein
VPTSRWRNQRPRAALGRWRRGAIALLVLATVACGHPAPATTGSDAEASNSSSSTPTEAHAEPVTSACPGDVHDVAARTITFPAGDGTELYGAILGSGSVGVVLANDVPHPFCEDIPPAIFLARRGYRVIAFDYRDHENSARSAAPGRLDLDVVGAAAELRKAGSDRILLFGSYAGVAASILAAEEITPPVEGLVGFSPAARRGEYVNGPFIRSDRASVVEAKVDALDEIRARGAGPWR